MACRLYLWNKWNHHITPNNFCPVIFLAYSQILQIPECEHPVTTNTHFFVLMAIAESSMIIFPCLFVPFSNVVVCGISQRYITLGVNSTGILDVITLKSFCIFATCFSGKSLSTWGWNTIVFFVWKLWNCNHPEWSSWLCERTTKSVFCKSIPSVSAFLLYCPASAVSNSICTPSISIKRESPCSALRLCGHSSHKETEFSQRTVIFICYLFN